MHPLFDPADDSKDPRIAEIVEELDHATNSQRSDDGRLRAPTSSHILVLRKPLD